MIKTTSTASAASSSSTATATSFTSDATAHSQGSDVSATSEKSDVSASSETSVKTVIPEGEVKTPEVSTLAGFEDSTSFLEENIFCLLFDNPSINANKQYWLGILQGDHAPAGIIQHPEFYTAQFERLIRELTLWNQVQTQAIAALELQPETTHYRDLEESPALAAGSEKDEAFVNKGRLLATMCDIARQRIETNEGRCAVFHQWVAEDE